MWQKGHTEQSRTSGEGQFPARGVAKGLVLPLATSLTLTNVFKVLIYVVLNVTKNTVSQLTSLTKCLFFYDENTSTNQKREGACKGTATPKEQIKGQSQQVSPVFKI